MTVAEEIIEIFSGKGQRSYFGEPVSQLEHALQAAHFARQEQAPDHLIVAALLHDIGYLVKDIPEDTTDLLTDTRHEEVGESWLARRFGHDVCEPVHLHVAAKRYLCATDPEYLSRLSPASVQSLHLQGGPMRAGEVAAFEGNAYFREAVRLRFWDDKAKVPGFITAELPSYRDLIEEAASLSSTLRLY